MHPVCDNSHRWLVYEGHPVGSFDLASICNSALEMEWRGFVPLWSIADSRQKEQPPQPTATTTTKKRHTTQTLKWHQRLLSWAMTYAPGSIWSKHTQQPQAGAVTDANGVTKSSSKFWLCGVRSRFIMLANNKVLFWVRWWWWVLCVCVVGGGG